MNTLIMVILYNKKINDSETLNSLNMAESGDFDLLIVNNGPEGIELDTGLYGNTLNNSRKIKFVEHLDNKPLSHIYNDEINLAKNTYDRFIILDDDSSIPRSFFSDINGTYNDDIDLQLPVIYSKKDKEIFYPIINKIVFDKKTPCLVDGSDNVCSIGSGLIIYKSLLDKFVLNNIELFDRRFALYGVDFSLFRRISELSKKNIEVKIVISSFIEHSLSKTEAVVSESRCLERGIDGVLSAKFYSKTPLHFIYFLLKAFSAEIMSFRFKNTYMMLRAFLNGKHPRC